MTARPPLSVGIALLAGAAAVTGFSPFYFWPAVPLSLAVLFVFWWQSASAWWTVAVTLAWCAGFFGAGVSWLYVSLHEFGDMPAWLAVPAIALFCIYLASFVCAGAWLQYRLRVRLAAKAPQAFLAVMPAAFVAAEMLRGIVFGGFPWLTLGLSQTPGGIIPPLLAGYAPIFGGFGISWLLALLSGALALVALPATRSQMSRNGQIRLAAAAAIVVIAGFVLDAIDWTQPTSYTVSVALVQGNIDQHLKLRAEQLRPSMEAHLQLVESTNAKLIVLPETVLPVFLDDTPPAYLEALKAQAVKNDGDLLFGVPVAEHREGRTPYFNSVVSVGSSPSQRYDKIHLVVFGEFVPPIFGWVMNWLNIPLSGFTEGSAHPVPLTVAGERVAINICYEDAFGSEVARQLPQASLLVNASNMAWYGHSLAADQHGQMSQMRAMEMGRWMLRATNSGLTAAINQKGEIVRALPQFTRAVLSVEAEPRHRATPYVRWTDWPVKIGLLVLLATLALRKRKTA